MRRDEFQQIFKQEYYNLDRYFHRELRDAKKSENIQNIKEGLIHETAVRVWIRLQTEASSNYKMKALIWLIAPDIWKNYIKPKKRLPFQYMDGHEIENLSQSYEIISQLEAVDYMSQLGEQTNPLLWNMVTLHAEGHTFDEIAGRLNKTKSLVKKHIYNFRKENKSENTKPSDTSSENP